MGSRMLATILSQGSSRRISGARVGPNCRGWGKKEERKSQRVGDMLQFQRPRPILDTGQVSLLNGPVPSSKAALGATTSPGRTPTQNATPPATIPNYPSLPCQACQQQPCIAVLSDQVPAA